MKLGLVFFAASCIHVESASQVATGASPVSRVVEVLTSMKAEVEQQGQIDDEHYQKFSCWCTTNEQSKKNAISRAEDLSTQLQATILETVATKSQLETEIAQLKKARGTAKKSLETATSLRGREHHDFETVQSDLKTAIGQLQQAVKIVESNFGSDDSFLQLKQTVSPARWTSVIDRDVYDVLDDLSSQPATGREESSLVRDIFSPAKVALAKSSQVLAAVQQPAAFKSYSAKSGKILGVLKQMLAGMQSNLRDAEEVEASKQQDFEGLRNAKAGEIVSQTSLIDDKTNELASNNVALANAKHDLDDALVSISSDKGFLQDLRTRCTTAESEFNERAAARNEEIGAIGKALTILSDDSARELFSSTASFAQIRQQSRASHRAAALLKRAAVRVGESGLLQLANAVSLDAFSNVQKSMDLMLSDLRKQVSENDKKRETCRSEMDQNHDDLRDTNYHKKRC
mmetsp:Transcript_70672/g.188440  ORF Transcript_70672/g.188440 Transcript_70672/m.188440 type:complete len:459 (+) Transcript_70672:56-1432(+)